MKTNKNITKMHMPIDHNALSAMQYIVTCNNHTYVKKIYLIYYKWILSND